MKLKLLELTLFLHQIYQFTVIYFNFVRCWGPLQSKAIFGSESICREVYDNVHLNVVSDTVNTISCPSGDACITLLPFMWCMYYFAAFQVIHVSLWFLLCDACITLVPIMLKVWITLVPFMLCRHHFGAFHAMYVSLWCLSYYVCITFGSFFWCMYHYGVFLVMHVSLWSLSCDACITLVPLM